MLTVYEIFHSLQGEGPFMGRPAVFLRLSGCVKPYCSFCDTAEALVGGVLMPLTQIVAAIEAYTCSLVVVTGGEPFLQWGNGLAELEGLLIDRGLEIQYETSGRAGIPPEAVGKILLSPKLGQWPEPKILARAWALKVLWEEIHSERILRAVMASGVPSERVWLMPLGASREEQLRLMPLLWDVCRKHGFRLSPRLHLLAFDRKKGV
jgi:Organic radical activating enzymes